MTQQNETEHEAAGREQPAQPAAPAPPGPVYPSPYLDAGEGQPQAYLAPPQPGQPSYGSPPRAQGGRAFGGATRYGQSGYGQPGYGQPRYGQPAGARPAGGQTAASRRDPALAPVWHRLAAVTIDWLIVMLVSVVAFWSPLSKIWRELQAIATRYPDLSSPAAQAALNSVSRDPANQRALLYWLLGLFGIALVYFWVQHAAWGATVGKRALSVRVVRAADRSRIGVRQAGIRTVAFLAGPAILLLLFFPVNIVGGVLWAADAGMGLVDPRLQSLHDKLAGTVVVRQRALNQRPRSPQSW
jgi:uncharacterized RDD family membrane protein YckC